MNQNDTSDSRRYPRLIDRRGRRAALGAVALMLGAALFGSTAVAGERGRSFGRDRQEGEVRELRMFRGLELTKEQEERLEKARGVIQEAREAVRKERQAVREVMLEELAKPTPDAARLRAALDRRKERAEHVAETALNELLAVHAMLTPEQRQRLVERGKRGPGGPRDSSSTPRREGGSRSE